jgi:hypothetical protein
MRRAWTLQETEYLIQHYSNRRALAIAKALDRKIVSVHSKVCALITQGKLQADRRCYNRPWSTDETDYLLEYWGLRPDKTVAEFLHRSVMACEQRTKMLRICRSTNQFNFYAVATIFGVGTGVVQRWWKDGWIRAQRPKTGKQRMSHVDIDSVERFIRKRPYAYDYKRMANGEYLTNVAREVAIKNPYLTPTQAGQRLGWAPERVTACIRRGLVSSVQGYRVGMGGRPLHMIHRKDLPVLEAWGKQVGNRGRH